MKRTRIELLEMRLASARTAQIMLLNQVLELKARVAVYETARHKPIVDSVSGDE